MSKLFNLFQRVVKKTKFATEHPQLDGTVLIVEDDGSLTLVMPDGSRGPAPAGVYVSIDGQPIVVEVAAIAATLSEGMSGGQIIRWCEIGAPVMSVLPDGSEVLAAMGAYPLADGTVLEVGEGGILTNIIPALDVVDALEAAVVAQEAEFKKSLAKAALEQLRLKAENAIMAAKIQALSKLKPLPAPHLIQKPNMAVPAHYQNLASATPRFSDDSNQEARRDYYRAMALGRSPEQKEEIRKTFANKKALVKANLRANMVHSFNANKKEEYTVYQNNHTAHSQISGRFNFAAAPAGIEASDPDYNGLYQIMPIYTQATVTSPALNPANRIVKVISGVVGKTNLQKMVLDTKDPLFVTATCEFQANAKVEFLTSQVTVCHQQMGLNVCNRELLDSWLEMFLQNSDYQIASGLIPPTLQEHILWLLTAKLGQALGPQFFFGNSNVEVGTVPLSVNRGCLGWIDYVKASGDYDPSIQSRPALAFTSNNAVDLVKQVIDYGVSNSRNLANIAAAGNENLILLLSTADFQKVRNAQANNTWKEQFDVTVGEYNTSVLSIMGVLIMPEPSFPNGFSIFTYKSTGGTTMVDQSNFVRLTDEETDLPSVVMGPSGSRLDETYGFKVNMVSGAYAPDPTDVFFTE